MKMLSDVEVRKKGLNVLFKELGEPNAIRFLSQIRFELHSERIPLSLLRGMRANKKTGRIPYSRRFPAACCRELQKRDYLTIQDELFKGMDVDEIFERAKEYQKADKTKNAQ